MNRYVRTPLVLLALLMMLTLVLSGCGTDELEARLNEHISQADEEMESASKKTTDDLSAAKDDLSKDIEEASKKATDDLSAAKNNLSKDIEEASKKAADDLSAAKETLASVRTELEAKLAQLQAAQTSDKEDIAEAEKLLEELSEQLDKVEELCEGLEASGATDAELEEALKELKNELIKSVETAKAASVCLSSWNDATELLVEELLAELEAVYGTYAVKQLTYSKAGFALIDSAYNAAYVRLMRATTTTSAKEILASFKKTAADVRSIADEIYDKLMEAGETVNDIDLEDYAALVKAEELLDAATNIEDIDVSSAVLAEIKSYGEDSVDLSELLNVYMNRYDELLRLSDGTKIKAAMDEALAKLITPDTKLDDIYDQYEAWVAEDGNAPENVEGFADTVNAFEAAMARVEQLKSAREEADGINKEINELNQNITLNGASIQNQEDLTKLSETISGWVAKYFAAPYDKELPTDTDDGSENYNMVRHDVFEQVKESYAEKVETFVKAAEDFENALNAIPEKVDLLNDDEIEAAWAAYNSWVDKASLGSFDYSMGGGKTPADYYDILLNKTVEYNTLVKEALAAYQAVYGDIDGITVTIYDKAKVEAVLDWYDSYGVKDTEGKLVFEDGYVLSDELVVGEEDHAKVAKLRDDIEALIEAKKIEKNEVEQMIDAIGRVTTNDATAIENAEKAYAEWLKGTNAPEGFEASQFSIKENDAMYVIENYETLKAARETLNALQKEIKDIHDRISELADKASYKDFASGDECSKYSADINDINKAIETFKANNGGDIENNITEGEFAKLAAGALAVSKYELSVEADMAADTAKTTVNNTALDASDKENIVAAINKVLEAAKTDIDGIKTASDGEPIVELALAKFEGIATTSETFAKKLTETSDENAKSKLAISYENSLEKIVGASTVTSVEQYVGLVEDELDTVLNDTSN